MTTPTKSRPSDESLLQTSPYLNSLSHNELKHLLRQLSATLAETEQNLQLAAQHGQYLLTTNDQLRAELLSLQTKSSSDEASIKSSSDLQQQLLLDKEKSLTQDILMLEQSNNHLQKKCELLSTELTRIEADHEKRVKRFSDDLEQSRRDLSQLTRDYEELLGEREVLMAEKQEMALNVVKLSAMKADEGVVRGLEKRLTDLEERLRLSELEKDDALNQFQLLKNESEDMREKLEIVNEQVERFPELVEENERQYQELLECHQALEESRETIQLLSQQLSLYSGDGEVKATPENRSLFSEIDDKRQAMESQFNLLSQKHSGLVKAHIASVHQQERMKNHISRLTQLSSSNVDETKQHNLERLLAQVQAENRQLKVQITRLEKQGTNVEHIVIPIAENMGSNTRDEAMELLRLRVEQLSRELEQNKRELNTTNLMRADEQERLRKGEHAIMKLENEMKRIRTANAELQFKLDEIKSKEMLNEQMKEFDESNNVVPIDVNSKAETAEEMNIEPHVVEDDAPMKEEIENIEPPQTNPVIEIKAASYMKRKISITRQQEKQESNAKPQEPSTQGPKEIYVRRDQPQPECNQQ